MTYPVRLAVVALALATLAGTVQAQATVGFAAKDIHLRAGPARDYPIVAIVPAGYQLLVQGCLPNYSWCDVMAGPNRGWAYAGNISYAYQGANVPLLNYGAVIGIGVLGFVLNDYWNDYYRGRPWYSDRDRWVNRPHLRPAAPRPFQLPREVRPEHPRPPQHAAPIGPRPPAPGATPHPDRPRLPGVIPRPPRDAQPGPGGRDHRGEGQRDGPGRGDRQQR
jgi:uncharacterized protein YraI